VIDFAIVALPRSGTAWMANLLTTDGIVCWHDPLATLRNPNDVIGLNGGISDTGMCLYPELINAVKKKIVIVRDRYQCEYSLKKIGVNLPFLDLAESRLNLIKADIVVKFDDLFGYEAANKIHEFCIGKPLSKDRHALLNGLNVQTRGIL